MIRGHMDRILLTHGRIATMRGGRYDLIEDGALYAEGGRIRWIGPTGSSELSDRAEVERIDAKGALVTPLLVDCHTHLVYAGNRAREYEMRLEGASYEQIAKMGGGIASTMRATRDASDWELSAQTGKRLDALVAEGVGTVEIKSGYGLDVENELRCLRIARGLERGRAVHVRTTLLGAHALPPEFKGRADDYVRVVCEEMIPAVAREKLADAVDAFCEGIAFTPEQVRRVFEAARDNGLPVKLHADQLSDLHGAALAAEFGALSADHLEYTNGEGIAAMAKAGTVAVMLPGAFHFLRETRLPPVEALRKQGVRMAVATDSNPGTSPTTSLTLMMHLACSLFGLTPEEALAGATSHGAAALGLADRGELDVGKRAEFAVWDAEEPAELAYGIGPKRPILTRYPQ
ncbi:imidazolonepropionase [Betaproteobacteria bacterium GR16-43]|nr:imidazolonepropionase [Betaproteobacteria bacterium GR16-43]